MAEFHNDAKLQFCTSPNIMTSSRDAPLTIAGFFWESEPYTVFSL